MITSSPRFRVSTSPILVSFRGREDRGQRLEVAGERGMGQYGDAVAQERDRTLERIEEARRRRDLLFHEHILLGAGHLEDLQERGRLVGIEVERELLIAA